MDQRNDQAWKPVKERGNALERSFKALQESIRKSGPVSSASYALIGGIILLGFIGNRVDRWLDTSPWFLMAGLLLGIIVGFYNLAKVIWKR